MPKCKPVADHNGTLYGWTIFCPGCRHEHVIHAGEKGWKFNGDFQCPSFSPSLLVYPHEEFVDDEDIESGTRETPRCHSVITNGNIAFCSDSTHELKGQTVPLPELYV